MSNTQTRPEYLQGSKFHASVDAFLLGANGALEAPISALSFDENLQRDPSIFIVVLMWTLTAKTYADRVLSSLTARSIAYPQHAYCLLVNDPNELEIARSRLPDSVDVFVCSEHAFADVDRFVVEGVRPDPRFEAVYSARVESYKRLELASDVRSLCVISRAIDASKLQQLAEILPNAYIANNSGGSLRELKPLEVFGLLRESRCGLMLSAGEGANRSVIEYLLAGLPIITTPNIGGRDRALNPNNSIYVAPSPHSVSRGVLFAISGSFSHAEIQRDAVALVRRERAWFAFIVAELARKKGLGAIGQLDLYHHAPTEVRRYEYFSP